MSFFFSSAAACTATKRRAIEASIRVMGRAPGWVGRTNRVLVPAPAFDTATDFDFAPTRRHDGSVGSLRVCSFTDGHTPKHVVKRLLNRRLNTSLNASGGPTDERIRRSSTSG